MKREMAGEEKEDGGETGGKKDETEGEVEGGKERK